MKPKFVSHLSILGDYKHLEQPSTLKFDSNDNHIRGSDLIKARSRIQKSEPHWLSKEALQSGVSPIHSTPLPVSKLRVDLSLFETGIKVVDLLTPYKKGGKIGLFGGAGVGKTVVIMEFIKFSNRTTRV